MKAPRIAKPQSNASVSSGSRASPQPASEFYRRRESGETESGPALRLGIGKPTTEPSRVNDLNALAAPRWAVDLSQIGVSPRRPAANSLEAKVSVGAVDDPLERQADQIASLVMDPAVPVPSFKHDNYVVRRKAYVQLNQQTEGRGEIGEKDSGRFAPPIVREVLSSPGQPLDADARDFFESRFVQDFSHVRVHSDERAAESAQALNAAAYTVGRDLVFGAGQYAPRTVPGRRLLAHELTHTIQQTAPAQHRVQRTQQVTLRMPKGRRMNAVVGELRFSKISKEDLLKHGALLPSADQAHIGFFGDQLGYDPTYTDPTDPDRWNKLKEIIDSDAKIQVEKTTLLGPMKFVLITDKSRTMVNGNLPPTARGMTLTTEALSKQIYPSKKTMQVSSISDTNNIFYTTAMGSPSDSSLAHELFGHMWLALRGVPFIHPSDPSEIAAFGTLTAQNGIRDPFGNIYTGTVEDYINRYAGSSSKMLASPTQNVGPSLLQHALIDFKAAFSRATGALNGPWKVSPVANDQWEIIAGNYALAPKPAAEPKASPSPAQSAPKAPVAQVTPAKATPGSTATPQQAPATPTAVTQDSIEQDITTWYGTLNLDKQYVFLEFLESIQIGMNRHPELVDKLSKTLKPPAGMTPPQNYIP